MSQRSRGDLRPATAGAGEDGAPAVANTAGGAKIHEHSFHHGALCASDAYLRNLECRVTRYLARMRATVVAAHRRLDRLDRHATGRGMEEAALWRVHDELRTGSRLHVVWRWADDPAGKRRCWDGTCVRRVRSKVLSHKGERIRATIKYDQLAYNAPFPPKKDSGVVVIDVCTTNADSRIRSHQLRARALRSWQDSVCSGGGTDMPPRSRSAHRNEAEMHTSIVKKGKVPSRFCLASLNATTLSCKYIDGKPMRNPKLDAIARFCVGRNVDMMAIQEHRIRVPDSEGMVLTAKVGDFHFHFRSADSKGNGGVGWLLSPRLAEHAKVTSPHHRVIIVSLKGDKFTTHLLSGHAPHAGHDDQIFEEFASVIRDYVLALPATDRYVLALDANAALFKHYKIGNQWAKASGAAHDRFVDFLNSIRSCSISQVRQPRTVWTYRFPNGGRKQLDHICLPVRWATSARFIRSVDPPLPTGHRAIVAEIRWRLSLKRDAAKQQGPRWDLLQQTDLNKAYGKAVADGFDPATGTWEQLSKLLLEKAKEVLKPRQREPEIGDVLETMALFHGDEGARLELRERLSLRNKRFTYEDPRFDKFSLTSLASRTRFKEFSDEHMEILCEETNKLFDDFKRLIGPHPRAAYNSLGRITSVKAGKFTAPGATLEEQLNLTREHFRKMGGDVGGVTEEKDLGFRPVPNLADHLGLFKTGEITKDELNLALRDTASGRAPGTDCLPAEAFKVAAVRELILNILNDVYRTKRVPEEWFRIKQVPIPKKGDLALLANWRPICLLNTIVKLYDRVLLNRLAPGCEPYMRFNQSGFRRYRSVDEQAAALVHIISCFKRLKAENYALIVNFLDFAKAFPSTSWVAIRGALNAFQVPQELVEAVMVLYNSAKLHAYVATPDFDTESFPFVTGTMQGDTLAPYLFIVVLDRVLNAAFAEVARLDPEYGILLKKAPGTLRRRGMGNDLRLSDLDFADDIALLTVATNTADAVRKAQLMLDTVAEYASRANLFMKPGENKTAIMVFGQCLIDHKRNPDNAVKITMKDGRDGLVSRVPIVEKYKYLGRILDHANHTADTAIAARIKCGWGAYHSKKEIWKSQHAGRELKEKLLEIFVRPCLLPNCSTWIPTKRQLRRLNTEYTKMRRLALGLPKYQPNVDPPRCTPLREIYHNERAGFIRRKKEPQPEHFDMPSATITQSSLRLFGHVCRQHTICAPVLAKTEIELPPPPLSYLLFWQPTGFGKRKRGGNRRSLADYYLQLLHRDDQQYLIGTSLKPHQRRITMNCDSHQSTIQIWASDRKGWKKLVSRAKQAVNDQFFALAQ